MNNWYNQDFSNTNEDLLASVSNPPTSDYDNTYIFDTVNANGVLTQQDFKMPTYTYRNKDHFLGIRYANLDVPIALALTLFVGGETDPLENYQLVLQRNFTVGETGNNEEGLIFVNQEFQIDNNTLDSILAPNANKVWITLVKLGNGNLNHRGWQDFYISSLYIRGEGKPGKSFKFRDRLRQVLGNTSAGLKPVWKI